MINNSSTQLLQPEDLSPSHDALKIIGVFNPGATQLGEEIILLVRVAETVKEQRDDSVASPRIGSKPEAELAYSIDWFPRDLRHDDPRKFPTTEGRYRLTSISHLEVVRLSPDTHTILSIEQHPELFGHGEDENFGLEDPRITRMGDTFYITYVSVSSRMGVTTSLLETQDFKTFTRHGIIFPCENKDVVLFPEKIDGTFWAYHRPVPRLPINYLAIQAAQSPDLLHWGDYQYVLAGETTGEWDASRIGAGPPPIKTEEGWLTFYHRVIKQKDETIGTYVAGAILTDLNNPCQIISRTKEPLFMPEADFARTGFVDNVIFPTGLVQNNDSLFLFYGAADSSVAVMKLSLADILQQLTN